ncbi:hypothetical protein [Desulfurococcus amylolyticus]|uniref:hypothetical protein n=1 Tax=Desulfurococcus amylolyticus TaxID=94694 RepID=UPI0012EBC75B|nr:hypothetical protein [Desulfurococcus amylolyticus]
MSTMVVNDIHNLGPTVILPSSWSSAISCGVNSLNVSYRDPRSDSGDEPIDHIESAVPSTKMRIDATIYFGALIEK